MEGGVSFETGKPVSINFTRNTEKSPVVTGYGQDIEPHGRYMLHDLFPSVPKPRGWVAGRITFKKPLVLPLAEGGAATYGTHGWKAQLQRATGLHGKALSKHLAAHGFDAIVTADERGTAEIVDLSMFLPRRNSAGYKFSGTQEVLEAILEADPDDTDPEYLPDYEAIVDKARRYPSSFHQERHVTWIGTKGYLVRVPVENICFMEGNQWYFAHAAALLQQIKSGENHYFEAPAGRIYRVSAKDVKQSEKYEADGELDYQLGMVEPWTKADIGEYWAQLLDGNHRAAAAILAGDAYVDVYIGENYRDNVLKKDRI